MKVTVLTENTAVSHSFGCEHGLSLYIQTQRHKLLFDMGQTDLFLQNARKLGIDLSAVDIAVISHGHYDHGGGLRGFLQCNTKAPVYVQQQAFERHYSRRPSGITDIGLDATLAQNKRIVFTEQSYQIDETLTLFSYVPQTQLQSNFNHTLLEQSNDGLVPDKFVHEQNLIITEGGKQVLIAGCAHRGIVNIAARCKEMTGRHADAVIGGFHLHNFNTDTSENPVRISEMASALKALGGIYYTGHCTGQPAYAQLKNEMGDTINYLATGASVIL